MASPAAVIECHSMECRADGCDRTDGTYKDLCTKHYAQVSRTGSIIEGYGPRGLTCDCGEPAVAKGLCRKHYNAESHLRRKARNGPKRRWGTESCEVDGCDKPHLSRGFCESHYGQQPDRRERGREAAHRRRVHKRGTAVAWPIPPEIIQARIDYYGGKCYLCGGPADTIDHVKPIAKGGAHIPANLRPACLSCNSSKRDSWEGVGIQDGEITQ